MRVLQSNSSKSRCFCFKYIFPNKDLILGDPSSILSMTSSSTPAVHKSFKYDVFLSFRGEDTRKNFVDHLYFALQQRSIQTYKDNLEIDKGKRISDELIQSIQDSKFYIIVFSKNYASSSWCLNELIKIIESHKTSEHTAYPVFYDVEPSEVRNQSGAVGEAFAKHEKEEAAGKWREAMKEAADLAGWELKNTADGYEARSIQKIVEELSLQLRCINFRVDEKLVGMESRIEDVLSSLGTGFVDVRIIGIKGMGGGGKTTLARSIFDQISYKFEGQSFVENVREVSNASLSGLSTLQNKVLLDVVDHKGFSSSSVPDGKNMMQKMMSGRKVLLVLDDVDHVDQLEALAGKPNWFNSGSMIIITTRDEQVLVAYGVKLIHNVNLLSDKEAICLFSRYAFGREIPVQEYEEQSAQVVRYAAGLPLTIRVLGSFLCGKNKREWIDSIERLKTIPLKETLEKLELSYIGLEEDYREIFLEVACILKGWPKDEAIEALESCGFHATIGLRVLEQKSLITISHGYGYEYLGMHGHIEEMGRNIVRRVHPDKPRKHSRLWTEDEIEDILANDLGTKETRSMLFYKWAFKSETVMRGLRKMKELRFLDVSLKSTEGSKADCSLRDLKFAEVSQYFPNALRYLRSDGYPFRSLPKTFHANNLVALRMAFSRIEQLWEGGERKVLNKLRFLDLSDSMLKTIDLRLAPNLEMLKLNDCCDLKELHLPDACLKLRSLNLSWSNLRTLDLGLATKLELLNLEKCRNLVELHFPIACPQLRSFHVTDSKLRTLDIRLAPNLELLDLDESYDLVELHMPNRCVNLRSFKLTKSKLRSLDIGLTPNLRYLDLKNCYSLEELHMAIKCQKLTFLDISHSKSRTLDLELTPNLIYLDLKHCSLLEKLPEDLGGLQFLEKLDFSYTKIKHLPDSICMLKHLKSLKLMYCQCLEKLPTDIGRLECLETLILMQCVLLREIPDNICEMKCLKVLDLKGTCISHLPRSIYFLKGLLIHGSREFLQSCGFTSEISLGWDRSYFAKVE